MIEVSIKKVFLFVIFANEWMDEWMNGRELFMFFFSKRALGDGAVVI